MTAVGDYLAAVTRPALGDAGAPPAWDELVAPDGRLRPSWSSLAPRLATLGADDLRRLTAEVERRVADDGVVHPRPDADGGPPVPEPWRLDPLPLVLAAEEWARLEVGLVQRAELLEAVLRDLYGPQRLLADGVVPPEVVLGHPEFVRAAVDGDIGAEDRGPAPRRLVVGATDLARGPDGRWVVVGDRTQAPSGAGFAMQNRRTVARVLPDLHRDAGLHRLSPWFTALRRALEAAAPAGVSEPRVVVLSPGPQSETAFDQAFVARALGLPLVQGGDLVVRDGALCLRVLGGLERVDVVVRRVDAAWCDPLELRAGSRLGVPGLAEVARRGAVVVVNGLGSGVLENPGLTPFLPAACEALLGEELRLPAPATWWCGDPAGRAHVLAHLDDLRVLPIAGADRSHERLGREALARRVAAEPWAWVGQEPVSVSRAPRVVDGDLRPAPFTLRTFLVARGGSYVPMVGGLGQVGEHADVASSKDVWVGELRRDLGAGTGTDEGSAAPLASSAAMVPRVLEDLFWVGRYAERAEDALRLLLAVRGVAEDVRGGEAAAVAALQPLSDVVDELIGTSPDVTHDDRMRALLVDRSRAGTVAHAVAALEEAGRGVRDQLSGDVWMVLGSVDRALEVARRRRASAAGTLAEDAERALSGLLALAGVTAENMVRDAGWRMLDAGRGLERAHQVVALLRAALVGPAPLERDEVVAAAVLGAAESTVTFRRRYRRVAGVAGVLDLLVVDTENPRSVAFSLRRVDASLHAVPGTGAGSRPRRVLAGVLEEVGRADPAWLATSGVRGRPDLDRFLGVVGARLDDLGDAVAAHHFDADRAPRAYGEPGAATR